MLSNNITFLNDGSMTVTLPYLPQHQDCEAVQKGAIPAFLGADPQKRRVMMSNVAKRKGRENWERLGKIWKKKDLIDKNGVFSHERRNVETRFRLRRWGFNPAIFGVEGFVVAPQHA